MVNAYNFNIIDYDEEKLIKCDYTGTPILYPTPNRVVDSKFNWNDEEIKLRKNGKEYDCHGILYDECWQYEVIDESKVKIFIDFGEGSKLYQAFPFKHRITVIYSLCKNSIKIDYLVENYSGKELPFGFGLHPYFQKLCEDINVTVNAKNMMESGEKYLIPTGNLNKIDGFDMPLNSITQEYVFRDIQRESFVIDYKNIGLKVVSEVTPDFNYVVIYNPESEGYFCIENQTSSANAHNLYNQGFKYESGIICVPHNQKYGGTVKITIKFT